MSAHAYCMQIAIKHLLLDEEISAEVGKESLSLIIETSTSADAGIRQDFDRVVKVNQIEDHLRSIAFARKEDARAL